jgi:aquaporin Z
LVAISPIGRRSGAHLNPSITVAFWCQRHLKVGDVIGYVVGQFLGALAGTAMLRLLWTSRAASVHFGMTLPGGGLGPWEATGVEALMTAVLVLTIFAFVSSRKTAHWTPLAVWIVVAVLVWKGAPYTGTSLNPARSFGPAAIAERWRIYWVYVVGPLGGTLCAVGVWKLIPRNTLTAKLFHDPRYPSVAGSSLPVAR